MKKKKSLYGCFIKAGRLIIFILISILFNGNVIAAPITFNTALPVSKGQYIARGLFVYDKKSGQINDTRSSVDSLTLVSVLGYGVNSKLGIFGVLPSVSNKLDINGIEQRDIDVGDAEIFTRYEVFRNDKLGVTKRVVPFVGVRLPTGVRGVSGDETTDAFAGITYTSASVKQNFEAQIRYDRNGSDDFFDSNVYRRFSQGDVINADVSWQTRVLPKKVLGSTKGFWFAVFEANLNYSEKNKINGERDGDSGGLVGSITSGVQYSTRYWIGEIALRIPVIKNLNGDVIEPDYTLFSGLRVKF